MSLILLNLSHFRQIFKQFLTNRILKDPKQRRFFKSNDIYELFTLSDPDGAQGTETSAIFAGVWIRIWEMGLINSLAGLNICCDTGTGSDVKLPRKTARPRSLRAVNHSRQEHNHSSSNNETGADGRHSSTNIPTLKDGNTFKLRETSQGNTDALTDAQGVDQNGVDKLQTAQNYVKPASSALTSPQKRIEKRKHCDSSHSIKHKKRKHSRDARFEGHRIPHLVKKRTYKKDEPEAEGQKKSDDYVLAKLFKKSGGFCLFKESLAS